MRRLCYSGHLPSKCYASYTTHVTASSCGPLDNPANGQVTISGSTIGATATYTCNRGYVLRGVVSRVCQTTGVWSGVEPICEGKQLHLHTLVHQKVMYRHVYITRLFVNSIGSVIALLHTLTPLQLSSLVHRPHMNQ